MVRVVGTATVPRSGFAGDSRRRRDPFRHHRYDARREGADGAAATPPPVPAASTPRALLGASPAASRTPQPPVAPPPPDPRLGPYKRMLMMHLPRGMVEAQMRADGLDPALLDAPLAPSPVLESEL